MVIVMTANIILSTHHTEGTNLFLKGNAAFKITSEQTVVSPTKTKSKPPPSETSNLGKAEDYWMATTRLDYEKRLSEHEYIPIINIAPLTYQLAYLYGCLNEKKGVARTTIFTFWFREINTHTWQSWFVVKPYVD